MASTIEEMLRCQQDFVYFVENYVYRNDPVHGKVLLKLYDFQKRFFREVEANQHSVAIKYRQGGFTTFSVLYALWLGMFKDDQHILVSGPTAGESWHMKGIVDFALDQMPKKLAPTRKDNDRKIEFALTNSTITFAPIEAGRGRSLDFLLIDEAAFTKHMDRNWKCVYPCLSRGGKSLVLSTTNGVGNWFYDVYTAAQEEENGFHVIPTAYWEHPDYTPERLKQLKKTLGEYGYRQEILGEFVAGRQSEIKCLDRLIEDVKGFAQWDDLESNEQDWISDALQQLERLRRSVKRKKPKEPELDIEIPTTIVIEPPIISFPPGHETINPDLPIPPTITITSEVGHVMKMSDKPNSYVGTKEALEILDKMSVSTEDRDNLKWIVDHYCLTGAIDYYKLDPSGVAPDTAARYLKILTDIRDGKIT